MSCYKQNSKCHKAYIEKEKFVVDWYIETLDYDPNDEYWQYRDDPRPYTHWTDTHVARITYDRFKFFDIRVDGRDAANDLWRYLKHASLEEIISRYKKEES